MKLPSAVYVRHTALTFLFCFCRRCATTDSNLTLSKVRARLVRFSKYSNLINLSDKIYEPVSISSINLKHPIILIIILTQYHVSH